MATSYRKKNVPKARYEISAFYTNIQKNVSLKIKIEFILMN